MLSSFESMNKMSHALKQAILKADFNQSANQDGHYGFYNDPHTKFNSNAESTIFEASINKSFASQVKNQFR